MIQCRTDKDITNIYNKMAAKHLLFPREQWTTGMSKVLITKLHSQNPRML